MADKQRLGVIVAGGVAGLLAALGAILWLGGEKDQPELRLRALAPLVSAAPSPLTIDPTDPDAVAALDLRLPSPRPATAPGTPEGRDLAWADPRLPDIFWAQVPNGVRLLEDAAGRVCLVEFPAIDRMELPQIEGGGLTSREEAGDAVLLTTIDPDRMGVERRVDAQVAGRPVAAVARARWDAAGPTESEVILHGDGRVLRFRQRIIEGSVVASVVLGDEELGALVSGADGARPDLPQPPFCVPIDALAPEVPVR